MQLQENGQVKPGRMWTVAIVAVVLVALAGLLRIFTLRQFTAVTCILLLLDLAVFALTLVYALRDYGTEKKPVLLSVAVGITALLDVRTVLLNMGAPARVVVFYLVPAAVWVTLLVLLLKGTKKQWMAVGMSVALVLLAFWKNGTAVQMLFNGIRITAVYGVEGYLSGMATTLCQSFADLIYPLAVALLLPKAMRVGKPRAAAQFCPHCGKPLQTNATFCGQCGQKIQ